MAIRLTRKGLLGTTALVGALTLSLAAPAAAQDRVYNIPSQPLEAALRDYGITSGEQIIFAEALVRGRRAPAVQGAYSSDEALGMLLADSGLVAQRSTTGGIMIARAAADPQGGSAAGDGAEVEALIVTAQKREEDIQDVPIAISAFTQEDLTRSQIAGGPDLITQIPNFTFTKTNFASYSIQIRGIGTQAISATTDAAVAVTFNNSAMIRNRFFEQEFYDLERVEVLRGPQGTLYGRNATAGVVNIISAKPKFHYEAKLSGDVGNYSSTRVEGMVNIPLVEDVAALRLAGAWTKRDGYATNEITSSPIDGRDLWSTRLSLRFAPTDRIDANLIWEHFEEDDDRLRSGKQLCKKDVVTEVGGIAVDYYDRLSKSGQSSLFAGVQGTFSQGCERNSLYSPDSFQTPNGIMLPYYLPLGGISLPGALDDPYVSTTQSRDLRVIESTVDPQYRTKSDTAQFKLSFDLTDTLTLDSETVYSVDALFSTQDFNRFNTASGAWAPYLDNGQPSSALERGVLDEDGVFCDPQLGCSDRLVAVDLSTAESRQFSQELRLSSNFDGPFNFSVGSNFVRYDTEDKYYVFINSLSLISATRHTGFTGTQFLQYVPGVSDNSECLLEGVAPGNPLRVTSVAACTYIDPNPIGSLNDQGHNYFLSRNPYKLISYAAFGEAYYALSDTLKLTAGFRWTVDKKEAPRIPSWLLASSAAGYPVAETIVQEWREPTGRLALDWKPVLPFTDETLVYASYAHGYKAGGANPPGFVRVMYSDPLVGNILTQVSETRPKTFDPEFIDAFELGTKNTVLGGRATVNLAAFYYDYEAYQISEIVERSAFNRNFDATVWGVELEADWRPVESLRLGFKGGYQKTRIADGEQAIDLMDRTAGRDDWLVVRPFPTQASSCILPTYAYLDSSVSDTLNIAGGLRNLGNPGGGGPGGCEWAYVLGVDPQTQLSYVPNPTVTAGQSLSPGYIGFNPFDASQGHNFGEGFFKPLGGNELPNAPNWTATITADYTALLPNNWVATLHTDLHWQSESWWRIFNDHEYGKLDEYFTMNLAAIFTNEEAGWNVMAYIKNVTDETALTGAFLNSDDTGLTTNVFLTEPRLYGLRVTKAWDGGPLLGSFGERLGEPYPFTLAFGAQVQRPDAPYQTLAPAFMSAFPAGLSPLDAQHTDLDWGDVRELALTYRSAGGVWKVSAGWRTGETNAETSRRHYDELGDSGCQLIGFFAFLCDPNNPQYNPTVITTAKNFANQTAESREEHQFADLGVSYETQVLGLASSLGFGLRHGRLEDQTRVTLFGIPDFDLPAQGVNSLPATYHQYETDLTAVRAFEGAGPVVSWDAAVRLWGDDHTGQLDLDWSVTAGALFGERDTALTGYEEATYRSGVYRPYERDPGVVLDTVADLDVNIRRSGSATVPLVDLSLGLSYEIDRMKLSAGYRWERYFDAIDGGYDEAENYDRPIDGPYFKLSVGFGG